ncbi:MAG: peptidase S9 [Chitinivibrionales bacterium]|nr:peptidase S9 [Chitinivibrionales bacterium]
MQTRILSILIGGLLLGAQAQYFGRNKVQYEKFPFRVMQAQPFDIHYYKSESTAVYDAARMLRRWNERYAELFGNGVAENQPIILYANHADFQQTNVISGLIPQATGGVTEGIQNRVVIPLTGVYAENNHVLGHELVHVYHYAIMKSLPEGIRSGRGLPLWFIEGMSEYLSIGSHGPQTAMWLRDALINNDLPDIRTISRNPAYFPYRYGHALWAFIAGIKGDTIIPRLYFSALKNGFDRAVKKELGFKTDSLSTRWHQAVKKRLSPDLKGRINPSGYGNPVITGKGGLNLSPAVSPNGKYVAFFSRKDVFNLSLYLADLETGNIVKKLIDVQSNKHFDALRFMNSVGAWSPQGKRFAYIVYKNGKNSIRTIDIETLDAGESYSFDKIESITGIAWSPDADNLAIAGTHGAIGDLYLYNMPDDSLTQLTADRFAQIQPAWSPDGTKIVFITDQHPATSFDRLVFSEPQIGIYDLDRNNITTVGFGAHSKHVSPHFSADGTSLYFVAAPDGFSDIFRYSFDDETYYRITRIATGVTGLTALSPSLSVAAHTNTLAFTVFDKRQYNLYVLSPDRIDEQKVTDTASHENLAAITQLPPFEPGTIGMIDDLLDDPGEVDETYVGFATDRYDPGLSPVSISRIAIGGTVDRFGVGLAGGAHLLLGDILGRHLVGIRAQISGSFEDAAAQVVYHNRAGRLNWLTGVGHIPFRDADISSTGTDTVIIDSQQTEVERITITDKRTFNERIIGGIEFPLNINQRFEVSGGYTHIWSQTRGTTYMVDDDGDVVESFEDDLPEPNALNLVQAAGAFVSDYSIFGLTSPVKGRRYRLEIEPTVGSLNYVTLLADYRHYFNFRPLTIALKAFHYGRYFEDGENQRLSPLHVGYPTLVRGYEPWTFGLGDCDDSDGLTGCRQLDRLFGSRIVVGNIEARAPLFGVGGYGLLDFRFLPTSIGAFADAGVAWTAGDLPNASYRAEYPGRIPVASAGFFTRFNLLSVLVLQLYYAYPFQRIDDQWRFGWVLAPGW